MHSSRPIRGALQRQTRGAGAVAGPPGCQDVHPTPAAQAASIPARDTPGHRPLQAIAVTPWQRPGGRSGLKRWVATVSPPGAMRSKPQTPRAGRLGSGGLAANYDSTCLDVARRRGPWVLFGPLASCAPSVLVRVARAKIPAYPAPPKNTGDVACLGAKAELLDK